MKFSIYAVTLVSALVATSSALAGSGAPGQPPAGSGGSVINPKFDTDSGEIDVRNVPVDLMAGYYRNAGGASGTSFKASGGHEIFIFGEEKKNSITTYKRCRTAPADGGYDYECQDKKLEGHTDKMSLFKVNAGGEVSAQVDADKGKVMAYKVISPTAGVFGFKQYKVSEKNGKLLHNGGVSFELASIGYENSKNDYVGLKTNAAVIEFLKTHGQIAFKINDVNFDICGGVKGQIKSGEIAFGDRKVDVAGGAVVTACAGVQIGKIANIRNEFNVGYLGHQVWTEVETPGKNTKGEPIMEKHDKKLESADHMYISNTVSADKIGGSPVGAYWDYRSESVDSGGANSQSKSVKTHTFGIKSVF